LDQANASNSRCAFQAKARLQGSFQMGLALLPEEEIGKYQKLLAWIRDAKEAEDFPVLEVAMSFASVGNAPPFVSGSVLRRVNPSHPIPYILFLFSAGSVCFQIDLLSDQMEDEMPPLPCGAINIKYAIVVGDDAGKRTIKIQYGDPIHQNWSSAETTPQSIKAMALDFNTRTCEGRFTPMLRD
jgi:hypothetical protein